MANICFLKTAVVPVCMWSAPQYLGVKENTCSLDSVSQLMRKSVASCSNLCRLFLNMYSYESPHKKSPKQLWHLAACIANASGLDALHLAGVALRTYDADINSSLEHFADYASIMHGYILQHFVLQPTLGVQHTWTFYNVAHSACIKGHGKFCTWDCLHALGHGILVQQLVIMPLEDKCTLLAKHAFNISNSILQTAIFICTAAPTKNHAYLCADGLFMSYFDAIFIPHRIWHSPCAEVTFSGPCFRSLFTQGVAYERYRLFPSQSLKHSMTSCRISSSLARRGCIWGLSLWAFPSLDVLCSYDQAPSGTQCQAYPMPFDTASFWSPVCKSSAGSSLLQWCSRFRDTLDDWFICISGSVGFVAEMQRHPLDHLNLFCSQLRRAGLSKNATENAVSMCHKAATSYTSGNMLKHIYPVELLEG